MQRIKFINWPDHLDDRNGILKKSYAKLITTLEAVPTDAECEQSFRHTSDAVVGDIMKLRKQFKKTVTSTDPDSKVSMILYELVGTSHGRRQLIRCMKTAMGVCDEQIHTKRP